MKPIKLYQIFHIDLATSTISRLRVKDWDGGFDNFFESEEWAEKFIMEHFADMNSDNPHFKLVILPVYCCESKI
jgi:hypothetical protein